jgi:hypothetical protein
MMRLKVKRSGEGLHPSEVFVSVETKGGEEELAIDPKSLRGDTISIGWRVGQEGSYVLVELPRPTSRGYRRVWVDRHELIGSEVRP